jgi:hypothetical protein
MVRECEPLGPRTVISNETGAAMAALLRLLDDVGAAALLLLLPSEKRYQAPVAAKTPDAPTRAHSRCLVWARLRARAASAAALLGAALPEDEEEAGAAAREEEAKARGAGATSAAREGERRGARASGRRIGDRVRARRTEAAGDARAGGWKRERERERKQQEAARPGRRRGAQWRRSGTRANVPASRRPPSPHPYSHPRRALLLQQSAARCHLVHSIASDVHSCSAQRVHHER